MTEIRVPKTPKSAFNKNRPASELLRNQVKQLEAVAERLPHAGDTPVPDAKRVKTEGQVADFIRRIQRVLNPEAAQQTVGAGAVPVAGADSPVQDAPAEGRRGRKGTQGRKSLRSAKATKGRKVPKGTKTATAKAAIQTHRKRAKRRTGR